MTSARRIVYFFTGLIVLALLIAIVMVMHGAIDMPLH